MTAGSARTSGNPNATATESDELSGIGGEGQNNVHDRAEAEVEVEERANDIENKTMTTDAPHEKSETADEESHEDITGFKLLAVMGSVTLTAFLMLLDGSIIGTVSSRMSSYLDGHWEPS